METPRQREAEFFPDKVNLYVPKMHYHSDIEGAGLVRVTLGNPPAADADGILNDQSIATAGITYAASFLTLYSPTVMGKYGRNVTVVASGAATSLVTVRGVDYLGQPMTENFTLNGTTPVVGKKAFKKVDSVEYAATAATTIDVGWGALLGVPFAAIVHAATFKDGGTATLTGRVTTDPQTATAGDPRGTYSFSNAPDGTRVFEVAYWADRENLHGIAHYYA